MSQRDRGHLLSQAGIVGLLAAYACFAWPGLYHLAAHVLDVREHLTVFGWQVQRAWLYPAAVDGGIFVAGCILLTHPELRGRKRLWRELWCGMWAVAALSGAGLVADELSRLSGRSWGWLPIPLILAPVVIATWFLHMVVTMEEETDGLDGQGEGQGGVRGRQLETGEPGVGSSAGTREGRQQAGGREAGDRTHPGQARQAVAAPYAGGSGFPAPEGPDPSAPPGSVGDLLPVVAASPGNGHAKTKTDRAVEAVVAYRAEHDRSPSRPELMALADCSDGTAAKALALTRKG